jgi:hypothetical protein
MEQLAETSQDYGDPNEAGQLLRNALALHEEVQGSHHPDVAQSWYLLHCFHDRRGEEKEADEALDRAIGILLRVVAIERSDWHRGQEIFDFVLPPTDGNFRVFERICVSEDSANLITLTSSNPENVGDEPQIERRPLRLEEVAGCGVNASGSVTLSRLADTIEWGYSWLREEKGWPPECYALEELTDPFRFGIVPAECLDRFMYLKTAVRERRHP